MPRSDASLSDETINFIENAKPAKPRRFVMVTKGAQVLNLVIFKKGNLQNYIKEAKEAGTGVVSHGVFSGGGKNLVFQLAQADGFDAAPVKNQVLKAFLAEQGLDFKPTFEIVNVLPPVPDAEDLVADISGKTSGSPESNATPSQGALSQGAPSPATPSADDRAAKLNAAVRKLQPPLTTLVADQPQYKPELVASLKQIIDGIKQSNFDDAEKQLISLAKRIKELHTTDGAAAKPDNNSSATNDLEQTYRQLLAQLEPLYQRALAGQFGDTSKLRVVMGYAIEQAAARVFEKSITALQRLQPMLAEALSGAAGKETDVIAKGLVAERAKLMQSRWQAAVADMTSEVEKLRSAIRSTVPDEDADEIADEAQAVVDDFCEELNDAIFAMSGANVEDLSSVSLVKELISAYRQRIKNHGVIQFLQLARQELGEDAASYDLAAVFLSALDDLESRLAS